MFCFTCLFLLTGFSNRIGMIAAVTKLHVTEQESWNYRTGSSMKIFPIIKLFLNSLPAKMFEP